MYLPHYFEENRLSELHGLIQTHPLATIAIVADGEVFTAHLPMLITRDDGEFGTLHAHMPRSDLMWQQFVHASDAVAIFQGEQTYVSPNWYPSKQATGKQVPTWNYAVVHVHGKPRAIEDADWLFAHLNEMTDAQEAGQRLPWRVTDAPRNFIDKLMGAIVGIEMPIKRIKGKWKMNQDETREDQLGVATNLRAKKDETSLILAEMVEQRITT